MDFYNREDTTLRQQVDVGFGVLHHRFYNIPNSYATASWPTRGTLETGGNTLTGLRILSVKRRQPKGKGQIFAQVDWIEPQAKSGVAAVGTYQEVRSSRRILRTSPRKIAICVGVSSDLTNVPARGDAYPGESGILALRAVEIKREQDTVPGLYYIVTFYRAFRSVM